MSTVYSDPDSMAAALFAEPSQSAMQYIAGTWDNYAQRLSYAPPAIRDTILRGYETFRESMLGRKADALRYKLNSFWQEDAIRPIYTVGDMQQAPNQMLRWIMAHTPVRELYHANRIEGYGDRYIDPAPGVKGEELYDYRRATDGLVMYDAPTPHVRHYYETPIGEEVLLTHLKKAAIQIAWKTADICMDESNTDPTSEWNGTVR